MSSASERIEVRVEPELKHAVERAAAIRGTTTAAFVKVAIGEAAREAIDTERRLLVSDRDWRLVCDLLEEPATPIPGVVELFSRRSVLGQ